ncbi:HAMP domain-containing histidine kinase [Gracilibacillus caseinilyticus]|uniref:Signal transduction histidine-protein kinase ArlS n=1 Tax=Gracilibacillus caseinilyticus TaxID=2932256 RepID=A0ABY4EQG1_9BACI|nr:ATP-binding protein [Gracilibacillus caseinilyticus]UOQ46689.1 HAMP domain-containing histidine kinase [Gracilibacillus caseinilyticus]
MKLRTKIQIFLTVFLILVILIINSAVYLLYENRVSENELNRVHNDVENIMEAIAKNKTADIENERLLQALLPANSMIRIIDPQGEMIDEKAKEPSFLNWPSHYTKTEEQRLATSADGSPYAQIAVPLIWTDGSIVTLQVSEALYAMEDGLSILRIVLFLSAGLMLIPALVAGYYLAKLVTKPVQSLTTEMKRNPHHGKWEKLSLHQKNNDEISQMQQAYNAMIERINENIENQDRFVSDASHELRTPLSVITSYTELLHRRGKDKPEIFDEATGAILSEAERMNHLTEQMLLLAKNQGQESISMTPINISEMTRDVVRSLSTAYQREIKFTQHTANDVTISADRSKIQQAIYIVMDNACKYSDEDVLVQIKESDSHIHLSITDQGEGLAEEDQKQIFERFYRVDKARSRQAGGTGLGLAICHQIVQLHGGDIKLDSQPGNGSTFTIEIPK